MRKSSPPNPGGGPVWLIISLSLHYFLFPNTDRLTIYKIYSVGLTQLRRYKYYVLMTVTAQAS